MTTIHQTTGGTPTGTFVSRVAPDTAVTTQNTRRADRVESLKQRIAAGSYDVEARAVADAIIASVRGTGRSAYEAFAAAARHRIG